METMSLISQEPNLSEGEEMKTKEICDMRMRLMEAYPRGYIRGQKIIDMPENQIYAIYKSHMNRRIPLNKPRMKKKEKQIPGQMNILSQM